MRKRSRLRRLTVITILYCLVVGSIFYIYFSSHNRPISMTRLRYTPSKVNFTTQPDSPVFSSNAYQPTDHSTVIHVYQRQMLTYKAFIMTVSNPKKVSIVTTKYLGTVGESVEDMVREQKAIAGVNGGSFLDTNWQGNGGQIEGIAISDGKVVVPSQRMQHIVGFTDQGRLVSGYYSLQELQRLHVVQALTFGPTLVQEGRGVVQGDGGWGYAPRTAVGQKADGTVIFIVTDGRQLHGINDTGASIRDIQNLMLEYGAVTAANLDGGSSATMVYKGQLVNEPTDILGQRKIGTAIIVR